MAPHRLESVFIVYPKSSTTLVQFGLQDEMFVYPELEIPTVVYEHQDSSGSVNYLSRPKDSDSKEIHPIVNGEIVNIDAFLQFLKIVYVSILNEKSLSDPNSFDRELSNIPFLLISHHSWSQFHIEKITHFVFEALQLNSFITLPVSLASNYAMISLQNSCIIDIGETHTDIVPVIDYLQMDHIASSIKYGGQTINDSLSKILTDLSPEQIEDLKKSAIFEVLSEDAKKESAFKFQSSDDNEDDSALDVAAIITSGRDTREILEERERNKNSENVPNSQLETNSFTDRDGNSISIGKQRFHGCDDLISKISKRVGITLSLINDITKQRPVWENFVIIGSTSSIKGFNEALLTRLIDDHLIAEPDNEKKGREQDAASNPLNKKKTKFMGSSFVSSREYSQVPTIIKFAKYPEYFPDWKKNGYSNIPFLGGQIVGRQLFTHSKDNFIVTKEKYNERGPSAIWDVSF
ncbi:hypothetical protein Kpol_181p2 [Vanderwaltozyma polyspora DSM 70294]|uniref:Actin-like protein ARP9 n=1 Tax=Vanderwaltozyma polyspora (strain ATCC 22028 / DSM 70294 / BCRC 21397 / CBS 2163 / NBRC 10782 / NRRL Y-8283 / UCD 57-17) TaxID=436907 RepID=A7TTP4_VANPO|nr:uncharacterized protein Kpol_181p2 [Vanderwaltozyma polyspora DSM 70294]EDO14362.1 hypothetical protein Kpol_181p2 [Vanderwaltozyma polyspora DSM 70294]